jgi:hypothetical protein
MKDTWKISKGLVNVNPNIPSLTISGKSATTAQVNVNAFADTSEQIFTTN